MEMSWETSISELDKFNRSLEMEKMSEILENFYKDLNNRTDYILIILYVPVIVLAFFANIMVIAVVIKYDYMRSVTNYFVVNLSIADLLVTLICMPMAVSQALSIIWMYGETMCKLFFYLQGVAVAASVFTITAMSIDRYLAIRSPIALRRVFNRKSTIMIISTLWIVALAIFAPVLSAVTLQSPDLPDIMLHDGRRMIEPPVFKFCSEDFKTLGIHAHIFGAVCFVLVYAIPGFIVVVAYSLMGRTLCARKPPFDTDNNEGSASSQQGFRLVRERKRVAWILLTLAILFALCWLPYNVLRLLIDLGVIYEGTVIPVVLSYFLFLGHANSALNPIVYCFMTRNFRRSFRKLICWPKRACNQPKSHRKGLGGAEGMCPGSSMNQRGWSRKRAARALAMTAAARPHGPRLALDRTATSSSGYDSSYSRHSLHRRCYMLRNLHERPDRPQVSPAAPVCPPVAARQSHRIASSLRNVDVDVTPSIGDPRRSQSLYALSANRPDMYESTNHTTQFSYDV